jgi:hypothetical protein
MIILLFHYIFGGVRMAYNLYDLGIKGSEIKRRLDLLSEINGVLDGGLATEADIRKFIEDYDDILKKYMSEHYIQLPEQQIIYLDAGTVTDYI